MTAAAATSSQRPWRLSARARRATLVLHIVSGGAWFGLDLAMAAMVFTALGTDDPETKALAYRALGMFIFWPIAAASVLSLATGMLLGLGTTYGLVRYWWVTIKLALNLVLTVVVLVALRPGVLELAEQGRRVAEGETVTFLESNIMFPPIVSTAALLVIFTLSVFKPFGRIRDRGD